jgi:methylated-DNA-[protein]-cysteine S-methyltransferase
MTSCIISTPFCKLEIHCRDDKITAVSFITSAPVSKKISHPLLRRAAQQMQAYCASRRSFDLPLAVQGTDFQRRVWAELANIPCGQVRTYGDIARQLSTSPRAVGNACRKNPIVVIVPCHRVVSQTGLGGFSGATEGEYLHIKHHLLNHEGVEFH